MTAQAGDRLLLDDKDCELYAYPELPPHHPRVIERTELEARAAFGASWIFSTGCWRRYCARWAIRGDRLYLDGIDGIYRLDGEDPLFASWVTTTLRIPQGEMLCYIHLGDSIFERDLVIDIKKGHGGGALRGRQLVLC